MIPFPSATRPSSTLLATLLVVMVVTACARSPRESASPDVVVIVLDTARPDFMAVHGAPYDSTPFLVELAKEGTAFQNAYSTTSWTLPSHASLFTGLEPLDHGATQMKLKVNEGVALLPDSLRAAGYQTAGFSNNPWISKRTGLATGFDHFEDRWTGLTEKQTAEHATVSRVRAWTETASGAKPFFLFVNLIEPHTPYLPAWDDASPFFDTQEEWEEARLMVTPPGGPNYIHRQYGPPEDRLDEDGLDAARKLYLGELRAADRIVKEIVAVLDGMSRERERVLFVLSDHGENFGEDGHVSHVFNLLESNIRIALLAVGPGFVGGKRDAQLRQITDVFPTIAEICGLKLSPSDKRRGTSLLRSPPRRRDVTAFLDYPRITLDTFPDDFEMERLDRFKRRLWSSVGGARKTTLGSDGELRAELLETGQPVPEDSELLSSDPWFRRLLSRLASLQEETGPLGKRAAGEGVSDFDAEARKALRRLGYLN